MASTDHIPDTMLLDAAYLPPGPGLEPAVAFYGPVELSPGAWRRAEEALGLPDAARRLTLPVGTPDAPRLAATRALAVHDAIPFLISLTGKQVRPSVNAWVVAAHIAQRLHEGVMLPRGTQGTDDSIERFAKTMPASSHAVLVETLDSDDDFVSSPPGSSGAAYDDTAYALLAAPQALASFLDVARHAYALGVTAREVPRRGAARKLANLTLRLVEPRAAAAPWLLRVQWPQEISAEDLQRSLVEAARLFRPLDGRTTATLADPVELSSDEASALILAALDLQSLGATIELPDSLTAGISGHVSARVRFGPTRAAATGASDRVAGGIRGVPRFRLDDLVSYDLSVALGGREVDAEELRTIARDARGLIRVGEGWVALTDQTRSQLEKLALTVESRDAHMANSHALAAALAGSARLPGGISAQVEAVDEQQLADAVAFLRSPDRFPDVPTPDGFDGTLRPYQVKGLTWLAGMSTLPLGACLADDMGLGKTVQVIALLLHMRAELGEADPDARLRALVVCPTSLIGNWQREINRFAPGLSVHVHHGPQRTSQAEVLAASEVVVTSYGLVARDRHLLSDIAFDIVAFDEAQSVKNPLTEQARAARALRAGFRVALTGTPMENRLLELWAILDLLNPGLLGNAAAFSRRFATPIERGGDEQAASTLRAITRPFLLRRVKTDPTIVPDLPDKLENTVVCTLTPEQAALYQSVADMALGDVRQRDGIARRGAVLALLTRLKQICNHPAQALGESGPIEGRSGKLERLEAMLDEVVAEGERALVFTQYAQMGNLLAAHLPEMLGCDVPYLHGGTPRARREELIAKFQAEGEEPMVFVLSLKAGGLGLNLMSASHVFHYDRWWNPAVEDQATDRTHRIGQTRQIQVHKLVCAGTLEERIASVIEQKRKLAGRIIEVSGTGEGWITELGDEELAELVALSGVEIGVSPGSTASSPLR